MTYPSSDVNATNVDAGTDSPATARTDLLDLITKFNLLRNWISTFGQGLINSASASAARTTLGAAAAGAIASSGLTQSTAKLIGRATAATGAPEEIAVGAGLALTASGLAANAPFARMRAGRYYNAAWVTGGLGSNVSAVANTVYYSRYIQNETQTMSAISMRITNPYTGNVRVGLYADAGDVPGALIATIGTASTSPSGIKDIAYATSVPAGNYWIALQFDAVPNFATLTVNATGSTNFAQGLLSAFATGAAYYTQSASYASGLPGTAASLTEVNSTVVPLVMGKF